MICLLNSVDERDFSVPKKCHVVFFFDYFSELLCVYDATKFEQIPHTQHDT